MTEGLATQICHFYFISLSANLFAYFFLRLSFSLFLPFWTFLFSYFLPHPPSISTPFSYLLPSLENGVTSNIDHYLLPSRTGRKYRYITNPTFYFHSHSWLSLFFSRKKILISYLFLSFLPYSFSRLLFRSFFSFSLLSSKISSKDFLILGGNLSCQPLCATSQSTKTSDQFDNCNNAVVTLNNWIEIQTVSQTT